MDHRRAAGDHSIVQPGQHPNDAGLPTEYFHWIAIWEISSGKLIQCFSGHPCEIEPDNESIDIDLAYLGALFISDCDNVLVYDDYSYSIDSLSSFDYSHSSIVNGVDEDYQWHVGAIPVDSRNRRVAIVYQEGKIEEVKKDFFLF